MQSLRAATAAPSAARAARAPACRPFVAGPQRRLRVAPPCEAFSTSELVPVMAKGEMSAFPDAAGIYAVFDKNGTCQYVGLSRKVGGWVAGRRWWMHRGVGGEERSCV